MILISDPAIGKLREVQLFFSFLDMIGEPPCGGLYFSIPRVSGDIGVAIQAGRFKYRIDFGRYVVPGRHGIRYAPRVVFGGTDKLDQYQDDGEGDEDFLDHGVKVRKRGNGGMAEGAKEADASTCYPTNLCYSSATVAEGESNARGLTQNLQ